MRRPGELVCRDDEPVGWRAAHPPEILRQGVEPV